MFGSSAFDKLLDKATSNLRLEPDWPSIMQICDMIRQNDVTAKNALAAIKKKICSDNPHVVLLALTVLESCVKNCGDLIHTEVSSKWFMEELRSIIKDSTNEEVKLRILGLLQAWAHAFRNNPKYQAVQDTVVILKAEGRTFPAFKESDEMFKAETAPQWAESNCCHRCRDSFGLLNRKHHCRACGQAFCGPCSSNSCTLPKYGFEKEVRVCLTCYEKFKKVNPKIQPSSSKQSSPQKNHRRSHKLRKAVPVNRSGATQTNKSYTTEDLPNERVTSSLPSQNQVTSNKKTDEELREEEELQLAMALSESEAEAKKKSMYIPVKRSKSYSPPVQKGISGTYNLDDDPELSRYLNQAYWEQKETAASQPIGPQVGPPTPLSNGYAVTQGSAAEFTEEESEIEQFANVLRSQVEIFVNRMKSNSSRGRSISNDSSVQTLFLNITRMHSQLLKYIQQQDDKRVHFESLQDKLTQIKDARAALDALREEHREKLRREAEIAERQRQIQMAQKLEIMRQKKQEYLQYQRQMALQRIREQEKELYMRQEQQKQQYRLGNAYGTLPYMPQAQGGASAFEPISSMGMNNHPSAAGPPAGSIVQPSYPIHYNQNPGPQLAGQGGPVMAVGQHYTTMPVGTTGITMSNVQSPMYRAPGSVGVQMDQGSHMMALPMEQGSHMMGPPMEQGQHMMGVPRDPGPHMMVMDQASHMMGAQSMQQVPRPMLVPAGISSSPLSSPSSSEHSIPQGGPPPIPSAPSVSSTPLPEEKEEVAELISFD